jgi:hypothetical protein
VITERINALVALGYKFQHYVVAEIFAVRFAVTDEQPFELGYFEIRTEAKLWGSPLP